MMLHDDCSLPSILRPILGPPMLNESRSMPELNDIDKIAPNFSQNKGYRGM